MEINVILFVFVINVINKVSGHDPKSSLTFVIDDTNSMKPDIQQVKMQSHKVFDAVINSDSQINEFVLVTFGDSDAKTRAVTKDPDEFKRALDDIDVGGGGDCPEGAMKGILMALEKSAPSSFLYIFTDASAKDYLMFEEVKSLSQKKSIQVSFLLTGKCGSTASEDYQVYHKIAIATSGQVFIVKKTNVHKIIEYIIESRRSKRILLAQKIIYTGPHSISFNVDSKLSNIMISASGLFRSKTISVVDLEGNPIESSVLVDTDLVYVLMLPSIRPGSYNVKINSLGKGTSVYISASTKICFEHGFSYDEPTSIKETSTRPLAGDKSYLSIVLTKFARDVLLKTAELRDTDENVIRTLPLKLVDSEQQLYVTEPFNPPEKMFKIVINGDTDTKEHITRVGPTYIEPQKIDSRIVENKPPRVKILGGTKVSVEINKPLTLKCIVEAYPKPEITWKNDLGEKFEPEVLTVDLSSDFKSILQIEKVNENVTYYCNASNSEGEAVISVNIYALRIGEPPVIKNLGSEISSPENEIIDISCVVKGKPPPDVKWLKDSVEISSGSKYQIFRDHALRFQATLDDSGNYSCIASNSLGVEQRDFRVDVYVPVSIHMPKETTINLKVGSNLTIICSASGYPEPKVQFRRNNLNPKELVILREGMKEIQLYYYFIQVSRSGYYTCVASNSFSSKNLTYNIIVEAPPSIDYYRNTDVYAIEGDPALRIPCKVHGNPKPTITWIYNGVNLDSFSEYQIIENDGTLVLKNPDTAATGSYTCVAKNYLNEDMKTYEVNVYLVPKPPEKLDKITKTLLVEEMSEDIKCDIPHRPEDIRWYKDGKLIKIGELRLDNPAKSDDGIYTCRVSNNNSSDSYHTVVTVGFKPKFISHESDEPIQFIEGSKSFFDCTAVGYPKPKVMWTFNGNRVNIPSMAYTISSMKPKDVGVHTCKLTNDFGSVSRTFRIKSGECQLNINNDFNGNQPLILTSSWKLPVLEISNGSVIVPKEKPLILFCPGSFFDYPGLGKKDKETIVCIKNSLFNVEGKEIMFSDLKCLKKVEPYARKNNYRCIRTDSELYTIGYKTGSQFVGVYDICYDNLKNIPIFSMHSLHRSISTKTPKVEPEIITSTHTKCNYDELYDRSQQISTLSSILGRKFESDSCHFSKRQLINSRDVLPGLTQTATYNYLNIMPHWSPCYSENWEEVEKRVRSVALSLDYYTLVWTGTTGRMRLPDQRLDTDVYLDNTLNQKQYVPVFLWKVVLNYELEGSVAIIQINIPNLTSPQALKYVKCEDICDKIEWLRYEEWHNVDKGYTYCCNIIEFENKFNYRGLFKGPSGVLYKIRNDVKRTKY